MGAGRGCGFFSLPSFPITRLWHGSDCFCVCAACAWRKDVLSTMCLSEPDAVHVIWLEVECGCLCVYMVC